MIRPGGRVLGFCFLGNEVEYLACYFLLLLFVTVVNPSVPLGSPKSTKGGLLGFGSWVGGWP